MNEEQKPKAVGWRKMGIGICGITALSLNPTIDVKIAAIIGFITFTGIVCQTILDYGRRPPKNVS